MIRQNRVWRQITGAFMLGLFFIEFTCLPPVFAGEQAEQAIVGVKKLIGEGGIAVGDVLKIVVKEGNIRNFWGNGLELKNEWEKRTGILLDARVRPQLAVLDFLRKNKDFDITLARQREYPDLVEEELIADLTPLVEKYGLNLSGDVKSGFIHPKIQSEFNNRVCAIPADGDIAILYLRKDLMEDPEKMAGFRNKYGRELDVPNTWEEYQDLVEFFHDPSTGFYGSCEQRNKLTGWMFWLPRYLCHGHPQRYLFDDDMHPLIDSEAGAEATNSYLATIPFSPPEILKDGNDYSYTLPIYKNGNGFSLITTMSLAKILVLDFSRVKGKFMMAPMPGKIIDGRLARRTNYIYGNNFVITRASKRKELAFLYAMWFSDPDISLKSITVNSGLIDPFRINHLNNRKVWSVYTKQAIDNLRVEMEFTAPAGTGLPGDAEYIQSLNTNLWLAGMGKISAEQAMENTAVEWEKITEKYGRNRQIEYFKAFKKKFPR